MTKKKIIFVALAAAFAGYASGPCTEESALSSCDDAAAAEHNMIFFGVDLRQVPQWDGFVIGSAHGEKGCVPIRCRTKEVEVDI